MKNKLIIVLILLLFIFANFIVYKLTSLNEEQRIKVTLKSISEQLKTHYELQLYHQTLTADAAYQATISKKPVIEILKKVQTASKNQKELLRKELFNTLIPVYKILTLKGVLQYQFSLKDNTTFLRLHKPQKYDDDLSKIRYSYTYVNKEHKTIRGLEQGKTTHGFRNVYPIFDENKNYLASVEISYSSDLIQKMLTDISKIHTHFIVDKKVIDIRAWKDVDFIPAYIPSDENKNFMMAQMKNHSSAEHFDHYQDMLKKNQQFIQTAMKKDKEFSFFELFKKEAHVISFYPIKNIKEQKTIAWIVAYDTNIFLNETINNSFYIRVLSLLLFVFLSFFTYFNLSQKEILKRKVKNKTKELEVINNNLEKKIAKEVEKNKKVQQQLFKSEKMASMGEMIGNIAHQWRQPLSVISTVATGMILQKKYSTIDDEQLIKNCELIDKNTQYLSKTIDDFRDFIQGDREPIDFNIQDTIESFLHLVEPSSKEHQIKVIIDSQKNIQLKNYPNELIQCLINIYNNSRDILKTMKLENRYIFISISEDLDNITLRIQDNAGGIDPTILPKIFEPYFTTKHKSQGTGLGLHMTYNLIVNGLQGSIEVKNITYEYKVEQYTGALFTITIPKKIN